MARGSTAGSLLSLTALALALSACAHSVPPSSPSPPAHPGLSTSLDAILDDPVLARGTWGVEVRSLKTGETLYARNEHKLLMPASNMKIVTLAAAAERLGWNYSYTTALLAAGRIDRGVLNGDLVVVGSGDPSLGPSNGSSDRVFEEWANELKRRQIRTVSGRVVGDDDAFEDQELGFGWSWDDLADDYAAGVGALQFNESAVHVTVAPGPRAGDQAAVTAEPAGSGVHIVNHATTSPPGSERSLSARRLPGQQRLEISGTIAEGSQPALLLVSVDNPTLFFAESLRRALIAQGIDIRGAAIDVDEAHDVPATPRVEVAVHRSPPLSTLAVRLMKDSQNQYAETFQKTLAAAPGSPANAAGARTIELQLFEGWGVKPGELIIRDGSGLSRYDYVTADALITILEHAYRDDRLRGPLYDSMPIGGRDGSLKNRMKGTPAEGNVHAKTGSMSNVRSLSGYVTTAAGEPLAFSIIANNFETGADVINKATDAIVLRLAAEQGVGRRD